MAVNYFAPLQDIRERGFNSRLSMLQGELGRRQDEQAYQKRSALSILADPRFTKESRDEFARSGNQGVLQSVQELNDRKKAEQDAADAQVLYQVLKEAETPNGYDMNRLRASAGRIPPSQMRNFVTFMSAVTPPPQPKPERDPVADHLRKVRGEIEIRKEYGLPLDGKGDKSSPEIKPEYLSKYIDTKNEYDKTKTQLGSTPDPSEQGIEEIEQPSWLGRMFGAEPDTIRTGDWSPEKVDSMKSLNNEREQLMQGYKDLASGKDTPFARMALDYEQNKEDDELLEQMRALGLDPDSILSGGQ